MNYNYDFAFSFAGEDREIVEEIKNYLTAKNYTVFFDNDFQYELVGTDLYSYLRNVYKNLGKYVVCFISENYTKKIWTNLEFTAIKERLMSTFFASDFLIPILIENANMLNDIPSYIGFYTHKTIKETADLLINKYNTSLVEDNYLYNIENCIEYVCAQLCSMLNKHGFLLSQIQNKLIDIHHKYEFTFTTDSTLNVPCILVFRSNNKNPDLFISWNNKAKLQFNIHSFVDITDTQKERRINELLVYLESYIVKYLEK